MNKKYMNNINNNFIIKIREKLKKREKQYFYLFALIDE